MRILIINNLASGFGDGSIFDFARSVSKDGDEVVIRSTDGTTDFRKFLYDASSFDTVVAAGGDGTVCTVAYLLADSNVPILPYPSGTANLLTQNLCSPNETHALAKLLREGKTVDFDLGEIDIKGNRYGFGLMAGCGYDAVIMEAAEAGKKSFGPLAYFGAALTNVNIKPSKIRLILDGKIIDTEGIGVLIMNFSRINFDIPIAHNNLPRDGVLDIAVLKAKSAIELIPALITAARDRDMNFPDRGKALAFYQAKTITIDSIPSMNIEYDGEITNQCTPFSARILPKAACFIVSEEGCELYAK